MKTRAKLYPQMEPKACHQRRKRRKLTKHNQSPTIPALPEELSTAILVRLPVKYLSQFKCVSKQWNSLISSSEFVKDHLSFSAKNYTRHMVLLPIRKNSHFNLKCCSVFSLFHESVTEALDLGYYPPMEKPFGCIYIAGSVNGLICIFNGGNRLILWNPSIRKFKEVLGFRPTYSPECWSRCGFGYDEVNDDYKVVGIFSSMGKRSFQSTIYSLKSDSWEVLDDFKPGVDYCGSPKFVNRKLHWVTDGGDGWGIMSIDLVDEKWGKVEPPCYEEGDIKQLGVLGNDLSVLCNNYQRRSFDVWVMKEYGIKESWTKLYTIRIHFEKYWISPPLCLSNKGEILLVFQSNLAIYNPKNESITYPRVTNHDDTIDAELCIESLVSPILQNKHRKLSKLW